MSEQCPYFEGSWGNQGICTKAKEAGVPYTPCSKIDQQDYDARTSPDLFFIALGSLNARGYLTLCPEVTEHALEMRAIAPAQ